MLRKKQIEIMTKNNKVHEFNNSDVEELMIVIKNKMTNSYLDVYDGGGKNWKYYKSLTGFFGIRESNYFSVTIREHRKHSGVKVEITHNTDNPQILIDMIKAIKDVPVQWQQKQVTYKNMTS